MILKAVGRSPSNVSICIANSFAHQAVEDLTLAALSEPVEPAGDYVLQDAPPECLIGYFGRMFKCSPSSFIIKNLAVKALYQL